MKGSRKVEDKALPHSAEAERAILGAVLIKPESLVNATEKIKPQDFFLQQNRKIFERMSDMMDRAQPIDLCTLGESLDAAGELEDVGGPAYLIALSDNAPRVKNVEEYARIVKQQSLLRRMVIAGDLVQHLAFDGDLGSAVDRAVQQFTEIAYEAQEAGHEISSFRDAASSLLMRLQEHRAVTIATGINELDEVIGGFLPGELVLLTASETGSGKTIMAMQIRKNGCGKGLHTLYCSGEMDAPHLMSRELATEAQVPRWKMRQPQYFEPEEIERMVEAAQHQCNVCHIHDGELSLTSIRSAARKYWQRKELDCVIVDYDELVESPGKDDLARQVSLVRGMKSLAIELKIPVILVSQLRKAVDEKDAARPSLSRIYGSGAKTKHASMVIFIDREYVRELKGDEAQAVVHMLKNRDGRKGKVECAFSISHLRFEDATASQREHWLQQRPAKKGRSRDE